MLSEGDITKGYVAYEIDSDWKDFSIHFRRSSFDYDSIIFDVVNEDDINNNDKLENFEITGLYKNPKFRDNYLTSSNNGIWKITASNTYNNEWNNYKIFNKEHGSRNAWLCNYNVSLPQYIQWENILGEKTKLNSYSLIMAYENSTKYAFKKWKFEGSNNGNNWELIHEQELTSTPDVGTKLQYNLDKIYEYSYFKFTILDGR